MSLAEKELKRITRRQFVKGAAVGAAGVAAAGVLGGCGQQATPCPTAEPCPEAAPCPAAALPGVPEAWDVETDVVVVGFGGAGAVTAIAANDAGAKVIVLEKAPIEGGGSSRCSGGFITVTTPEGISDAAEYLYTACGGATPKDVCLAWAEQCSKTRDWLTEKGIPFLDMSGGGFGGADFKNFPGAAALSSVCMIPEEGAAMNQGGPFFFKWATAELQKRGIEVKIDTPATALVQNPETKEILGVVAQSEGKKIAIKAKKGVVLACGGFEFNEDMIKDYVRPYPLKGVGWKFNTGDGIKMAQAVGADLWHMNLMCSAGYTYVSPESETGWWGMGLPGISYIWVDRYGNRFTCESPSWSMHRMFMAFDIWDWSEQQKDAGYKCIPFYAIFDQKVLTAGPIYDPAATVGPTTIAKELGGMDPWSADNSAEVEKGWIKKADNIRDLAAAIGADINADILEATVAKYNEYCAAGEDPAFHRPAEMAGMMGGDPTPNLVAIDTPPFYALELYPAIYSSVGGPRKNGKGQVLDTYGNPIPRLYVAGVIGHSAATVYSTFGQNWAEIMGFGRISGTNAAGEQPWA